MLVGAVTVIVILAENGLNVVVEIENFRQLGSGGLSEKAFHWLG